MNRTRLIRQPGQPGTKRLVEQYGPKLVCVRYRYDAEAGKRYKTVELIVEESNYSPSQPGISPETIVGVHVGLQETTKCIDRMSVLSGLSCRRILGLPGR